MPDRIDAMSVSAKASSHDRALRPRQNILCHRPEPLAQFRMFEMRAALGLQSLQ